MMRHWLLVMLLYFGMALTGCGQKGPLFIPDKEQPAEAQAPSEEPTSVEEPPQP